MKIIYRILTSLLVAISVTSVLFYLFSFDRNFVIFFNKLIANSDFYVALAFSFFSFLIIFIVFSGKKRA